MYQVSGPHVLLEKARRISEKKLNETFPAAQFILPGFCNPHRFDRNSNGDGIMFFIREDISSPFIERKFRYLEYFFVEINLRKKSDLSAALTTHIRILMLTF